MSNAFTPLLHKALAPQPLNEAEAEQAFTLLMEGGLSPVVIAAFLTALRVRGETVAELTGAARVMRAKALTVRAPEGAIDTCGTGGDNAHSYNISTAAAILTAACGAPVAKHGNKAASSKSGSADVLTSLGLRLDVSEACIQKCFQEVGIAFLLAPKHHTAIRHVQPVRRELGVRTIFNLLGPLANPAGTKYQLLGVFAPEWMEPLALVAGRLGAERVWVVHGAGGLDELSTLGESQVVEWRDGAVNRFTIKPEDYGLARARMEDLRGGAAEENAAALSALIDGEKNAYRDIAVLNAGAALVVAGKVADLAAGVKAAERAIDDGRARATLDKWIALTVSDAA